MRDMTPAWPRWTGFLALATLCWWCVDAFQPDRARMATIAFARLASSAVGAELEPLHPPGVPISVGRLETDWGPDCQRAIAPILADHLVVVPGAAGHARVSCELAGGRAWLEVRVDTPTVSKRPTERASVPMPDGLSLLPPLLAVLVALLFGRVYIALLGAILLGAFVVEGLSFFGGLGRTLETYVWKTAIDPFNLYVFAFTLVLIGMVHVSIACGGMQGVIDLVARVARGFRTTQVAVGLMGIAIFFDDYANSIVVGSAARGLTDSRGISREKLAYIVDSTAAPVAGLAIISTWIGVEVDLFQKQLTSPEMRAIATSGYDLFFQVLPYRFYCIFAVLLVFLVALTGRDWGTMLRAERRAQGGAVHPGEVAGATVARPPDTRVKEGVRPRWANGVLPILTVVLGTFVTYAIVGQGRLPPERAFAWTSATDLADAFTAVTAGEGHGNDGVLILFLAAVAGAALAVGLALGQRLLSVFEVVSAFARGARSMLPAIVILVLAIGIRGVTSDLETATYLSALLGDADPLWLPLATFLLAGAVAFATGTSWGTMGILLPVAIPTAVALVGGEPHAELIILLVAASVLDGAIFGDHCSVISDTTVLSSMASGCPHVAHVKTQLPYALLAFAASGACGYGLTALTGADPLLGYATGTALMLAWLLVVARPVQAIAGKRRRAA